MKDRELTAYCLDSLLMAGADKAQCSLNRTAKYEMNVETGVMSLIRTTFDSRISFSAIKGGRKGSMGLNKLSKDAIDETVMETMELTNGSEPDPANDIAEEQLPEEFSAGSCEPDRELMYHRLKSFVDTVKTRYPKVILRNAYLDFTYHTGYFLNTNNVDFKASRGKYNFSMVISSKEGEKTSSFNYSGFSALSLDRDFIDCATIDTLLSQSEKQIDTQNIAGKFTGDILITPDCLDGFISSLVDIYLRDGSLITGTSIFKNKLNEQVADFRFSLHSMPASDELADGYFITADGYKAQNSTIIRNGILNGFVLSLYGSKKTGLKKAVNSGEAYVVDPGDKSFDDMVKSTKKGILLCRYSGGHPSRNGDFSGIAKNSFYIEDGEIKYPVSETMVSGNLASMFKNIKDISKERINFGSTILPWISVSDIVVSGK